MRDLLSALCLMAVLEGLMLFAFPLALRRMAEQLMALSKRQLRIAGCMLLVGGMIALYLVRG